MVQTHRRTPRGTSEPSILVDSLEEDAPSDVIPNLDADVVDNSANQDREAENVLRTTPNVTFLRALLLLKLQGC
jgi:hypothetical protein